MISGESGGAYDLPNVDDIHDAAAATSELAKLHAAAIADDKHPYYNPGHFQAAECQDRVTRLYKIQNQALDQRPGLEGVMEDALDEQAAEQRDRIMEAEDILGEMETLGYSFPESVPDDLSADEVHLLGLHRDCVRGDWPDVIAEIREALIDTNASADARALVRDLESETDNAERLHMAQGLLRDIWKKQRERFGLGPR